MARTAKRAEELEEKLIRKIRDAKDDKIEIAGEDARDIVFLLDVIKVTMRKIEEVMQ